MRPFTTKRERRERVLQGGPHVWLSRKGSKSESPILKDVAPFGYFSRESALSRFELSSTLSQGLCQKGAVRALHFVKNPPRRNVPQTKHTWGFTAYIYAASRCSKVSSIWSKMRASKEAHYEIKGEQKENKLENTHFFENEMKKKRKRYKTFQIFTRPRLARAARPSRRARDTRARPAETTAACECGLLRYRPKRACVCGTYIYMRYQSLNMWHTHIYIYILVTELRWTTVAQNRVTDLVQFFPFQELISILKNGVCFFHLGTFHTFSRERHCEFVLERVENARFVDLSHRFRVAARLPWHVFSMKFFCFFQAIRKKAHSVLLSFSKFDAEFRESSRARTQCETCFRQKKSERRFDILKALIRALTGPHL